MRQEKTTTLSRTATVSSKNNFRYTWWKNRLTRLSAIESTRLAFQTTPMILQPISSNSNRLGPSSNVHAALEETEESWPAKGTGTGTGAGAERTESCAPDSGSGSCSAKTGSCLITGSKRKSHVRSTKGGILGSDLMGAKKVAGAILARFAGGKESCIVYSNRVSITKVEDRGDFHSDQRASKLILGRARCGFEPRLAQRCSAARPSPVHYAAFNVPKVQDIRCPVYS